jgi:N-acetylneuraminic acid mutarotase
MPEIGSFSANIEGGMKRGVTYFIKPFIKSVKYLSYGNSMSFVSVSDRPPLISDFNPTSGKVGSVVTIEGDCFNSNPEKIIVRFGTVKAKIIRADINTIEVEVPYMTNDCKISVEIDKSISESSKTFSVISPWSKITSSVAQSFFSYNCEYCFSVNGKAYLVYKNMMEFGPQNNWVQKQSFPLSQSPYGVAFSILNKGYVLSNGFWEYNPLTDTWTKKADFPGQGVYYPVEFTIGNKCYVGLGTTSTLSGPTSELYEYNPDSDTWTKKANFPLSQRYFSVGIGCGSKGYVISGISTSSIKDYYEYDPSSDTWTNKGLYPGSGNIGVRAFSINNKIFFGLGYGNNINNTDFWQYTPSDNSWKRNMDGPKIDPIGYFNKNYQTFTINNMGYFSKLPDLYIYNPAGEY